MVSLISKVVLEETSVSLFSILGSITIIVTDFVTKWVLLLFCHAVSAALPVFPCLLLRAADACSEHSISNKRGKYSQKGEFTMSPGLLILI